MATVTDLEQEIEKIKERNRKVEADKSWETSWTRRILIALFTYLVIATFFYFAGITNPLINAIVPALAFILSTASLLFFKNYWMKHIYKRA